VTTADGYIDTLVDISNIAGAGFPAGVLAAADGSVYFTDDHGYVYHDSDGTVHRISIGHALYNLAIHPISGLLHVVQTFSKAVYSADFFTMSYHLETELPDFPSDIAFTDTGDAFITTFVRLGYSRIYNWSSAGNLQLWTTGANRAVTGAPARSAWFQWNNGIAIDTAGNMLISDTYCNQVWWVDANTGLLKLVAGGSADNAGSCDDLKGSNLDVNNPAQSRVNYPTGVVFGPGGWAAFFADTGNNRIVKVVLECLAA
jgi:hypothetical protein